MVQAARSGKQNVVEGSFEQSVESNIKLTGVARASYGELLEDYRDYLRENDLKIWDKDDPRVLDIRQNRDESYRTYKSYKTYMTHTESSQNFANLMITLCFKEGYLLDRLLQAQKNKFIREGGFRENLFKSRMEFRKKSWKRI